MAEETRGRTLPGRRPVALEGWPLVGWSAIALLAMEALLLAVYGIGEEGLRVLIRATARSSLLLFLPAFAASSLRRLWPTPFSAWLLRNRRYVGVSFAISHFLHLDAILGLAFLYPDRFDASPVTIVGGGLGYAFIAAMVATSSDAAVRKLGERRWKLLHRTGMWVLFVIFAQSYVPAPFYDIRYLPASLATLGALGLRIAAWLRSRPRG
jgi:DMSO/TMAO reductase YedYZ heme-binding membrane subunit